MDIQSLKGKIPNEILESLQQRGITVFTPPQEGAILSGLLDGKNMVVAAPTASGKTLVAELACINSVIRNGKKAVYIAPMRALVMEKYSEFKEAYPYVRSIFSIGDLDRADNDLAKYDMIFVSTEKFDSLMRHGLAWIDRIGCIVFDEVHMLGDNSRGPTLEVLMTKLSDTCDAQMVALSATIGNADEIADWMEAKLVQSDWRPVKLKKGVTHDGTLYYMDESAFDVKEERLKGESQIPEIRILEDTLERKKQILIFYSTKRNAESGAAKLSLHTQKVIKKEEQEKLDRLGDEILNVLDRPTVQCDRLSKLVKKGIAFHHAGLVNAQRWKIEQAFREGLIKAICSTTTLGLGVNLPANTVLVRDLSRFDGGGSSMIDVNVMLQLFGRAGRPKYDKEGRALIIAVNKERVHDLYRKYIAARPEPIDSSLGVIPVLRTHVLAFISENFLNSRRALQDFMKRTFYGFQFGNEHHIKSVVGEVLKELIGFEFVEQVGNDEFRATRIGKRVSELYIDPLSARWMLDMMENKLDTIGILYMVCNTLEMRPHVKATREAEEMYVSSPYTLTGKKSAAYGHMESMYTGYYDPVRAFSTAIFLNDWMEEKTEPEIIEKYRSTPGELFGKRDTADWMIYSAIELARLVKVPAHDMVNVRVRLRYGIKEELLDLVRLEQIGRARARMLFINGIRKVSDIRANKDTVTRLLGKEIAAKVISQVE